MKKLFYALVIMLPFMSCTNNDEMQTELLEDNFYALKVGNSWVYKNYKKNTESDAYNVFTGVIDSISIVGTEQINGNLYYKFRRVTTGNNNQYPLCYQDGEYYTFLRDSIGFLIDHTGKIEYSNNSLDERIQSTHSWGTIYEQLQSEIYPVNVEAGTFECLDTYRYAKNNDNEQLPSLDHYHYSKGVGLVNSTLSFVSAPFHSYERRLDTYNIQL